MDTGKAEAMQRDGNGRGQGQSHDAAADDNGGPEARIEDAVVRLARIIGRQIAREQFRQSEAANDNAPAKGADER